jgi:hypothetical protein
MPYLVKIGAIRTNKSGVGSRGYHIYRRSHRVITVWGRVEVKPRGKRFYWASTTQYKEVSYPSIPAALERMKALVDQRIQGEKYSLLPRGARIHRSAVSARNVPNPS